MKLLAKTQAHNALLNKVKFTLVTGAALFLSYSYESAHAFARNNSHANTWQENSVNQLDNFQFAQKTNKIDLEVPAIQSSDDSSDDVVSNKPVSMKNSKKKMWNLDDVDLLALIGEMSRITGRNFIIDSRVTGKASLISNKPMDDEEAYQAFLSILQVQGFAVIDAGSVTKIVPDSIAKQIDSKVNSNNLKSLGDEMVVQVISVKNVSATALLPILRGLVNQQVAHLAAYAPSNVIVVADHAANVARIIEIINRIDKQNTDDVEIISLKDASSDEIVKVLSNLMSSQQLGDLSGQQIKMAADLRTNSILLSGDKSKRVKVRALIAQMDVPTPRTGDTEVIRLNYQTADALVPVIASIVDSYYSRNSQGSSDNNSRNMRSNDPSMAGAYRQSQSSNSNNLMNNNGQANGMASTLQLPDARREGGLSAPGVRSEPNTNALVVTAPPELMKNIKAVIAELDVRRFQVLVEALIVEVTMDHTQDLGVEWRVGGSLRGGTNFPPATSTSNTGLINGLLPSLTSLTEPTTLLGRSLPVAGMTVGFLHGGDLKAVLTALQRDTNTNIVSTPSLVAMDNETAEIVVADRIPFQTASSSSTITDSSRLTSTFEYKPVGLSLKLTPMITKGDAVKLTIEQTTGSVKNPGNPSVTPTTSERSIKTAVLVNNKDILVLGGLIQGQQDAGESKIPILGDMPLIGNLFKRTATALTKKNLMVFIRPVVMRNNEESNNVSLSKYDYTRDGQLLYKLDPYAKIAKELIMELPVADSDADLKDKAKKKLVLPDPFDNDLTVAGLTL